MVYFYIFLGAFKNYNLLYLIKLKSDKENVWEVGR